MFLECTGNCCLDPNRMQGNECSKVLITYISRNSSDLKIWTSFTEFAIFSQKAHREISKLTEKQCEGGYV